MQQSPTKGNGPIRATLPMASLLRHNCIKLVSPCSSPVWSASAAKVCPADALLCSGQRSPGAFNHPKTNTGKIMRRTASLDAIYLKGQWPPEGLRMYCGHILVDKATQTSEDWICEQKRPSRFVDSYDDKLEKYIRHRLQQKGSSSRERGSPLAADHSVLSSSQLNSVCSPVLPSSPTLSPASAIPIPSASKPAVPRMRNSIEGLNQEIERLVLKTDEDLHQDEDKACQATPDGHKAPLAEMLRSTRSVNTQTPAFDSTPSSGPPSCGSISPVVLGCMEFSRPTSGARGGSTGSSPELHRLGTSPHINRFCAREPPDGCEKISTKVLIEDKNRRPALDISKMDFGPLKPSATFQLRPSLGSAFQPLSRVVGPEEEALLDEAAGGEEQTE
ncbi:protein FAM117B-like [Neocloeon triangulifer]|uniref:protein FAM117B-like n=1 Tax=Neocloeon triangulifer TaxID=2078957 RepID=UPI00286EE707|nr:protein FAM117B-like [Neocloeon triangulifer]